MASVLVSAPLAGLVYFLMGPIQGWMRYRTGNVVEKAAKLGG